MRGKCYFWIIITFSYSWFTQRGRGNVPPTSTPHPIPHSSVSIFFFLSLLSVFFFFFFHWEGKRAEAVIKLVVGLCLSSPSCAAVQLSLPVLPLQRIGSPAGPALAVLLPLSGHQPFHSKLWFRQLCDWSSGNPMRLTGRRNPTAD